MPKMSYNQYASKPPKRNIVKTVYVERLLHEKFFKYKTKRTYVTEKAILLSCGHIVEEASYREGRTHVHCHQCADLKDYTQPQLLEVEALKAWATPDVPTLICMQCQCLLDEIKDMFYIDEKVYCKTCFDKNYLEILNRLDKKEFYGKVK